jgi:hypothetical protein
MIRTFSFSAAPAGETLAHTVKTAAAISNDDFEANMRKSPGIM